MQSADLNLTTTVTGHQRFLFIKLPEDGVADGLAEAMEGLGDGMENMHHVGWPAIRRGVRPGPLPVSEGGDGP